MFCAGDQGNGGDWRPRRGGAWGGCHGNTYHSPARAAGTHPTPEAPQRNGKPRDHDPTRAAKHTLVDEGSTDIKASAGHDTRPPLTGGRGKRAWSTHQAS